MSKETVFFSLPPGTKLYKCYTKEEATCRFLNNRHVRFIKFNIEITSQDYFDKVDKKAKYQACACSTSLPITKQSIMWPSSPFITDPVKGTVDADSPSGFVDLYSAKNYTSYCNRLAISPDAFRIPSNVPAGFVRVQHCHLS